MVGVLRGGKRKRKFPETGWPRVSRGWARGLVPGTSVGHEALLAFNLCFCLLYPLLFLSLCLPYPLSRSLPFSHSLPFFSLFFNLSVSILSHFSITRFTTHITINSLPISLKPHFPYSYTNTCKSKSRITSKERENTDKNQKKGERIIRKQRANTSRAALNGQDRSS